MSDLLTVLFGSQPGPSIPFLLEIKVKGTVGRESNMERKRWCSFCCWSWYRVNEISTDYPFKTPRILKRPKVPIDCVRKLIWGAIYPPQTSPSIFKGLLQRKQTNQSSTLTILSRIPKPWDFPWSMENPASVLAAQVPHPSIDLTSYLICCWFNGYRMLYRESGTVWLSL